MTLKVWRTSRHHLLVECSECSSRGRSASVKVTTTWDSEIDAKRAELLRQSASLREKYSTKVNSIMARHRASGMVDRRRLSDEMKEAAVEHAKAVRDVVVELPDARAGIRETVSACPWCDHESEAVVVVLPEGVLEPDEWTAEEAVIREVEVD